MKVLKDQILIQVTLVIDAATLLINAVIAAMLTIKRIVKRIAILILVGLRPEFHFFRLFAWKKPIIVRKLV